VNAHGGPYGRLDFESETFLVADPLTGHEQDTYTHEGRNNFRLRNVVLGSIAEPESLRQSEDTVSDDTDPAETLVAVYGLRRDLDRPGEAITPSADATGRVRLRDAGFSVPEDISPTLDAVGPHAVAFALRGRPGGAQAEVHGDGSQAGALRSASGGSSRDYVLPFDETQLTHPENRSNPQPGAPSHPLVADGKPPAVAMRSAVRRLTPTEAERLQGMPDGYTAISYRRRAATDGVRYRSLGNSYAVPVVRWIGERLAAAGLIEGHAEQRDRHEAE